MANELSRLLFDARLQTAAATIRADTLVYTGLRTVASTCFIYVRPYRADASITWSREESILIATTRDGVMCRMDVDSLLDPYAGWIRPSTEATSYPGTNTQGFRPTISTSLRPDVEATLKTLARLWRAPDPGLRSHPLHYLRTNDGALRPASSEAPVLQEGVVYEMRMDWALPFLLVATGDGLPGVTRLFPFDLATSYVHGHEVPLSGASHPCPVKLVRITRADSSSPTVDHYVTEILRKNAAGTLEVVDSIRPPTPDRDGMSQLAFGDQSQTRAWARRAPRLALPFDEGFLYLLKIWLFTVGGYEAIHGWRVAEANFVRESMQLEFLQNMMRYINEDRASRHVHASADGVLSMLELGRSFNRYDGEDARAAYASRNGGTFGFLLDLFVSAQRLRDEHWALWAYYPSFLGPITFLECAMWVLVNSSKKQEALRALGANVLAPPRTPGQPIASMRAPASEAEDVMLLDARFFNTARSPELANDLTQMFKRSLSSFAIVGRWFLASRTQAILDSGPVTPLSPPPGVRGRQGTLQGIENVIAFRADMEVFDDYLTYLAQWNDSNPAPPAEDFAVFHEYIAARGYRVRHDHPSVDRVYRWLNGAPASREEYRKIQQVAFGGRLNLPTIAASLDCVGSTLGLLVVMGSVRRAGEASTADVLAIAQNVLGLGASGAELFARQTSSAVLHRLAVVAEVANGLSAGYDAFEKLQAHNYYVGAMRGIQVVASGIAIGGLYAAASGVGFGVGFALMLTSTLLSLAAEVAIWYDRVTTPEFRLVARSLIDQLEEPPIEYSYAAFGTDRAPVYAHDYLLASVRAHRSTTASVLDRACFDSVKLRDVPDASELWEAFPEAKWRFLDLADGTHERAYRVYEARQGRRAR